MRQVKRDDVWAALSVSRTAFLAVGGFSLVLNVLTLVGPLYMMQVYDRVMSSRSIPTLLALSLMMVVLYALSGFLDLVRSRIMSRISLAFDAMVAGRVFDASARLGLVKGTSSGHHMREFDTLRQFISGPGPAILFDVPWVPIYLALLFVFHWTLGTVALAAAALLFSLALVTERLTAKAVGEATQAARRANDLADAGHGNAEVLAAMGMLDQVRRRWVSANRDALLIQSRSGDTVATLTALSKTLRMVLQSAVLGLGAYLSIQGSISAGAVIAGSILLGRALAPVEQAIAQWRSVVRARQAYLALSDLVQVLPQATEKIELPEPVGRLDVKGVRLAPPGANRHTVLNVSFTVNPGQLLAIAGQSASGKSTLARALVGVWPISGGEIRLDGARLDQWDPQRLGSHIGYVPQDVELFSGSVRENIARFRPDADDADIIAAAQLARAHHLILDLPQGYDTELGAFGSHLSAGQKQRIALARALYGNPALLVLDEPNSNLDSDGDAALLEAIADLKAMKRTIVIVSHRTSAIAKADLLLVLENGQQRAFGPREEVVRQLQNTPAAPARAQAPAASVASASPPPQAAQSKAAAQPVAVAAPAAATQRPLPVATAPAKVGAGAAPTASAEAAAAARPIERAMPAASLKSVPAAMTVPVEPAPSAAARSRTTPRDAALERMRSRIASLRKETDEVSPAVSTPLPPAPRKVAGHRVH